MNNYTQPYDIQCNWDSSYLCKKCGELLYYDIPTKTDICLNPLCEYFPKDIEIFSTEETDLTFLNRQLSTIEKNLGQIINTCDYYALSWFLLEIRRRIVQKLFTSGSMNIKQFLLFNELLLFIQNYKSLGIRNDPITFNSLLKLYTQYNDHLKLIENIKEGRYLLARKPQRIIFRMKFYDVIEEEIWVSYGLINLESLPNANAFRYHEVIQKLVASQSNIISSDYAQYFDRLWPLVISFQYLTKISHSSSLKYQYSITPVDMANILSITASLKNNNLIKIPAFNLLKHLIKQPIRDRNINDFINMLSGKDGKIPIIFRINGDVLLDRRTLLLFSTLIYGQHLKSTNIPSGQQILGTHKTEAGTEYENYLKEKLENIGYRCLPTSIKIAGFDYDLIAISEYDQHIMLIEAKFKDPSASSFSRHTLISQELTYEKYGLLPQAIKHQNRYNTVTKKRAQFERILNLNKDLKNYSIRAYLVTKFSPLISTYGNVSILSEKEFTETVLTRNTK